MVQARGFGGQQYKLHVPGGNGLARSTIIEAPGGALSKMGGPGATDEVVGSTDTPVVRLTADTQLLSLRITGAENWDTDQDVTLSIAVAINGNFSPVNGNTLFFDLDYIFVQSGLAATADLGKTATGINPSLTFTTAAGLAAETLYVASLTLDRNDVTNPYSGATGGGFSFRFNLNSTLGDADSIDVVAAAIRYPQAA